MNLVLKIKIDIKNAMARICIEKEINMKWFGMTTDKLDDIIIDLSHIRQRMADFEVRERYQRKYIENMNKIDAIAVDSQKWLARVDKNKARYEKLFQDTLAELIDLDVQSDDVLTAVLDGICWTYSEDDIEEYVNNEGE